jgi:uncharacterized damage-inducible protein DinB
MKYSLKTLPKVWAMFRDSEMPWRPHERARSVHEQMVHQCVSEDYWMKNFLGIDLGEPALPGAETRLEFMKKYAASSAARLQKLEAMPDAWFEENGPFFDVSRSRAWILVRRFTHSAHHRGQLTTYLRVLGHALYSTYGLLLAARYRACIRSAHAYGRHRRSVSKQGEDHLSIRGR